MLKMTPNTGFILKIFQLNTPIINPIATGWYIKAILKFNTINEHNKVGDKILRITVLYFITINLIDCSVFYFSDFKIFF